MLMEKMMPRKLRGFTLTEAAIVLGIVGLILGAIWVAAAAVYNNMRVSTTSTQLLQMVNSVRSLYATSPTVNGATDANLISASAVPGDMISGSEIHDVWGSRVTFALAAADTQFSFSYPAVPMDACIKLGTNMTSAGRDTGLVSVTLGASTILAAAFPISVATATAACTGATNIVTFLFRQKS